MKTIISCLTMLSFAVFCMAQTPHEIRKTLLDEEIGDQNRLALEKKILDIVRSKNASAKDRLAAIKLAGEFKVEICIPVLIEKISWRSREAIKDKGAYEAIYPSLMAIVKIGEPSIPKLTQAIGKESDDLRLRLMGYAVMKIKSKEGALKHFDECLASEITEAQRKSFNAAKVEVNKWHDENQKPPQE